MSDNDIITVPKPLQTCQFTSRVLYKSICFSPIPLNVVVSPSGRYIYLDLTNSFLLVDIFEQSEREYPLDFTDREKQISSFALFPVSDTEIFGIFHALDGSRRSPVIRHMTFNHSAPVFKVSKPAPFSILNYNHESSFLYDNCVGIFVSRKKAEGLHEDRCMIFRYSKGDWTTSSDILVGHHTEYRRVRSYSTWPTVHNGKVYSFLSCRYLSEGLERYLEALSEIQQIDLTTGVTNVLKAKNDLQCLKIPKEFLQHRGSIIVDTIKKHNWRGANLFIAFGVERYDRMDYPRHYMYYMAIFNLSTLMWKPICIKSMTPVYHKFPLIARLFDDSVSVLIQLKTEKEHSDNQRIIVQTWHTPILIGNPAKLSRLAQIVALNKMRSFDTTGEYSKQIFKSINFVA